MRIEKVGLQHQELLSGKLTSIKTCLSEYCFANIYLYRTIHAYEVVFAHKIFIRGKTRDGVVYYMPTENITAEDFDALQKQVEGLVVFFPLPGHWIEQFPETAFNRKFCPADSDYLYALRSMRTYPGRHLSGQRNFIKQFNEHYQVRIERLTQSNVQGAISVLQQWQQNQKATDYESCLEALQLHEKLGLDGLVFYDNESPIAFIIGEELNPQVYIFHFVKANTQYKGIYAFVYQQFALSIPDHYQYINLEQDLGLLGIRKAKQSYHPEKLVPKWRIRAISNPNRDQC